MGDDGGDIACFGVFGSEGFQEEGMKHGVLNSQSGIVVIYPSKWCLFDLFESLKLSKRGSQMVLKA